jgi:hypothetical protein
VTPRHCQDCGEQLAPFHARQRCRECGRRVCRVCYARWHRTAAMLAQASLSGLVVQVRTEGRPAVERIVDAVRRTSPRPVY